MDTERVLATKHAKSSLALGFEASFSHTLPASSFYEDDEPEELELRLEDEDDSWESPESEESGSDAAT